MKITSGKFRGISLFSPKGMNTRPTLGKIRQSVFNMLRQIADLEGALVIDAFAGTGAFGFEALSNGAAETVFIDSQSAPVIKRNAEKLKLPKSSFSVYASDFESACLSLGGRGVKAGLFFADPPYGAGWIKKILKILSKSDILLAHAIVVLEMNEEEYKEAPVTEPGWETIKAREYGGSVVVFLKKKGAGRDSGHI